MKLNFNRIETPFLFEVENEKGSRIVMDASTAVGGGNKAMRPMEVLASSLAGCIAIDVLLILQKQRVQTTHFSIDIQAERAERVPAVFEQIHLVFTVDQNVPLEQLDKTIRLVKDKYCSVSASLHPDIAITFETRHYET